MKPWQATQANIKRHHKVLAKYYHPDSGNDKTDGDAFKAVQEAYEQLSSKKGNVDDESSDTSRRRSQVRFMGSSVNLFLLGTVIFIFFVARHNRQRLGRSYVEYCLVMFLILQAIPRLLAAALIFSYISGLLLERDEALARSKALLVVEKINSKSLKLRIEGFSDDEWTNTAIEITVHEATEAASNDGAAATQSSHLKFGKGVREVVIPVTSSKKGFSGMDVYAVRDDTKMLVANKYCPY